MHSSFSSYNEVNVRLTYGIIMFVRLHLVTHTQLLQSRRRRRMNVTMITKLQ